MAPYSNIVIGVIVPEEVKVLHKTLEVVPHGGEVAVWNALLGAELPHNGLHLGKVVVVHAGEQVVFDVVVDAAVDPACHSTPTA